MTARLENTKQRVTRLIVSLDAYASMNMTIVASGNIEPRPTHA